MALAIHPRLRLRVRFQVEPGENCLRINDRVLVAAGAPRLAAAIAALGYETGLLDLSEFRKMDGALTCLSLRF